MGIERMGHVVCFGECMIELARGPDGSARVGFGGDTLNTALYLARLGIDTSYMTALGEDAWSADLKARWAQEGLDTTLTLTHPSRAAGLYAISTDARGERSFTYWRDQSAARAFFECDGALAALATASKARLLYLSGISLALFTPSQRDRIVELARHVRAQGRQVAFDPNYRARLWPSVQAFKTAISQLAPFMSVVLPSYDDEAAVWGDASPEASLARWSALGVDEVVVKHGACGALTSDGWVASQIVTEIVDTTGAGDSFNAGYLAARLGGQDVVEAARAGAALAAQVVQYTGAIMPRSALTYVETQS